MSVGDWEASAARGVATGVAGTGKVTRYPVVNVLALGD